MKTTNTLILAVYFLLFLSSCTKDDQRDFPSVRTLTNVEIYQDGTIIHAEIAQENVFEIIDHGVVFCLQKDAGREENYENISNGKLTGTSFSVIIDRNLFENEEYVAKAFIRTKEKTVFGNEITFISKGGKAPVINSFLPLSANLGDTISISGRYFSKNSDANKITFGNVNAVIVYSSDTIQKVIVPVLTESVQAIIKITVGGKSGQSPVSFELKAPVVYEIFPLRALPGEKVTIKGIGLGAVNAVTNTEFNNYTSSYASYEIKSISDTLLQIQTGTETSTGIFNLHLQQLDRDIKIEKQVEIYLPKFISINPSSVWLETVIEIVGTDLKKLESIFIGDDEAEIIYKEDKLIKVKVIKPFIETNLLGKINHSRDIYSNQLINFKSPVITSVTPSTVTYGENQNINGDYFVDGITTYVNGENTFSYISKNKATNFVSWMLPAGSHSLQLYYKGTNFGRSNLNFDIPRIEIASITPKEIVRGTEVLIKFDNLPPSITKDNVTQCLLDNNPMTISEVSGQGIKAVVDETFGCSEFPAIALHIGAQVVYAEQNLHLNQPWQKFTFPEVPSYNSYALCATYVPGDNALYAIAHPAYSNGMLTGVLNKYSPGLNKWDELNYMTHFDFDAPERMFSLGNDLYVVGYSYSKQEWNFSKYSKSTRIWSKLKGIPDYSANSVFGGNLIIMVVDERIFVGKRDWLYEYDAVNNKWLSRAKIPSARDIFSPVVLNYNSKVMVGFPTYSTSNSEIGELYEYDPQTDQWRNLGEHKSSFFLNMMGGVYSAFYNNKFYLTGSSQTEGIMKLVEFDPANLIFREMIVPFERANGACLVFFYNNQLYLGSHKDVFYKIPVADLPKIYK